MKKASPYVLAVVAHPDDEALGCGGTLARHISAGDRVRIIFLADGEGARSAADNRDMEKRKAMAQKACAKLGVTELTFLDFPDNRMDSVPRLEIIQKLEEAVDKEIPDIIYTHHSGDLNIDHRIAHDVVLTAFRPTPECRVRVIRCFEVLSSTEWGSPRAASFVPDHFIDISRFIEAKMQALQAYEPEMRSFPHSRSLSHVEALARHRGSCVGLPCAEAFSTVRTIEYEEV